MGKTSRKVDSMSLPPNILQPLLPPNTIVPENKDLFIPYLNRLYEDIAFAVNAKDFDFFTAPITDTPTNIPNLPNFGSFIVCVSGLTSDLPTLTVSLCKASNAAAGVVSPLGSQVGFGTWAGIALTITSTATNFQIAHNNTGVTGNFNIRIIGTQG
jgi:hypothetical protein